MSGGFFKQSHDFPDNVANRVVKRPVGTSKPSLSHRVLSHVATRGRVAAGGAAVHRGGCAPHRMPARSTMPRISSRRRQRASASARPSRRSVIFLDPAPFSVFGLPPTR